jgi:hypothetical protein
MILVTLAPMGRTSAVSHRGPIGWVGGQLGKGSENASGWQDFKGAGPEVARGTPRSKNCKNEPKKLFIINKFFKKRTQNEPKRTQVLTRIA